MWLGLSSIDCRSWCLSFSDFFPVPHAAFLPTEMFIYSRTLTLTSRTGSSVQPLGITSLLSSGNMHV